MTVIHMARFGGALVTRAEGRRVFETIAPVVEDASSPAVFDFAGTELTTTSFADEVFGRMALEHGETWLRGRTTFRAVDRPSAKAIRSVIDARDAQRSRADAAR